MKKLLPALFLASFSSVAVAADYASDAVIHCKDSNNFPIRLAYNAANPGNSTVEILDLKGRVEDTYPAEAKAVAGDPSLRQVKFFFTYHPHGSWYLATVFVTLDAPGPGAVSTEAGTNYDHNEVHRPGPALFCVQSK